MRMKEYLLRIVPTVKDLLQSQGCISLGCYIKELVSRLTAKPVCTAEKVALFALLYAKINVKSNHFFIFNIS